MDLKDYYVWNSGNLQSFQWRSKLLEQDVVVEKEREKVEGKGINVEPFVDVEDRLKKNTSTNFLEPIPPEYFQKKGNIIYLQ